MRNRRIVAISAVVVLALGAAFVLSLRERQYDPDFDTAVATPAYSSGHPLVLYDEGHLEAHTADAGYRPFAELLRHDGYELRVLREPVTPVALAGAKIFVVVCARGSNDANDAPAFADAECAAIEAWVRGGGALLLVSDHWPFGVAVAPLAQRFGVTMGGGMAEDEGHCDATLGPSHLWFTRENGLLRGHPITDGRHADERVERVLTFTGQSLLGPPDAVAFLALSDDATERPPGPPRVQRDGGDVIVSMDYGDPQPVKGRAQGLALEVGSGRVVVLGESGLLRAQKERNGTLVGMNHPGCDNRKLALNIVHWLSRALAPAVSAAHAAREVTQAVVAAAAEPIVVTLTWDAQSRVTTAQVGTAPSDGASLDERLRVAKELWAHEHHGEPRVALRAASEVPWEDLIEIVSACTRVGLKQVDVSYEGDEAK